MTDAVHIMMLIINESRDRMRLQNTFKSLLHHVKVLRQRKKKIGLASLTTQYLILALRCFWWCPHSVRSFVLEGHNVLIWNASVLEISTNCDCALYFYSEKVRYGHTSSSERYKYDVSYAPTSFKVQIPMKSTNYYYSLTTPSITHTKCRTSSSEPYYDIDCFFEESFSGPASTEGTPAKVRGTLTGL